MNKTALLFMIVGLLLVAAVSAAPQVSISKDTVAFGGEDQERSNPDSDDEDDHNVHIEESFTITNTGNETAKDVQLSTTITASTYNVTFSLDGSDFQEASSFSTFDLDEDESVQVTMQLRVPEDFDSVTETEIENIASFDENIETIGSVSAESTSNSSITDSADITLQAENMLQIKDVNVCINDDCESLDDGDDLDEIPPGATLRFEIEIENDYSDSDSENLDFEDVTLQVAVDDGDLDEEEEEDDIDLDAEESMTETIEIELDDDVEDDTYTFVITLSGEETEFGALHGEHWTVDLQVERETHDIIIENVDLDPTSLTCGFFPASVTATVDIKNLGKRDEDEVAVELRSDTFGYKETEFDLELDENDEERVRFNIPIPPRVDAGSYGFEVVAMYDDNRPTDTRLLNLVIPQCEEEEPEEPSNDTSEDDVVTTPPQQPTEPTQPTNQPLEPETQESVEFTNSGAYVTILVVLVLTALGAAVFLVRKILQE